MAGIQARIISGIIILLCAGMLSCSSQVSSKEGTPDAASEVIYEGNRHTDGGVPIDENKYVFGAQVTILGNIGTLVKTDSSLVGWCVNAK